MPRPVQHKRRDLVRLHALRLGQRLHILRRVGIEVDGPVGIAAANRDLVHVCVGRVQKRARLRHGHHGQCIG